MSTETYYAIKDPYGEIWETSLSRYKRDCLNYAIGDLYDTGARSEYWKSLYRDGYRCVKVRVVEVME